MDNELKLEVVEYWIDNEEERCEIPSNFKNKMSEADLNRLSKEIGDYTKTSDLMKYKEKLERKIQDNKILNLQKETLRLNKITTTTQYLIVFISIMSFFASYYVVSAKPYGPGFECPKILNETSSIALLWGNYGDVPIVMIFEWKGENIEGQSNWWQKGFKDSLRDGMLLMPIKYDKELKQQAFVVDMKIKDVNKTDAKFLIKWSSEGPLETLLFYILPPTTCSYKNENEVFKLI